MTSNGMYMRLNYSHMSFYMVYFMILSLKDTAGAASSDLPKLQFNFIPIDQLSSLPKNTLVDVIGVCKSTNDVTSVTVRTSNQQVSNNVCHGVCNSLCLLGI